MHFTDPKTILSQKNSMNLYRGCSHGCIYCDSRSRCYQIKHDFEDIEVKRNAPAILEAELKRKRKPCMIATGAMCDPYLHLEEKLQMTHQCLEVIEKHGFGLSILTKSSRILRDLNILKRIHTSARCVVQMTLTTFDDDLCRKIEPHVSPTSERIQVLETMRDEGIPTVVWLCPTLPFINDSEENLRGLLAACIRAEVKGILCFGFGLTLREGNREHFYQILDRDFPGMKARYSRQFGNAYVCNSPNHPRLMRIFTETCQRHHFLHQPDTVFAYLSHFEEKDRQLKLF